MPLYRVEITRPYTIVEGFTRVVRAEDEAHAREIADKIADRSNQDCPDDCSEICGDGAGSFVLDSLEEVTAANIVVDEDDMEEEA